MKPGPSPAFRVVCCERPALCRGHRCGDRWPRRLRPAVGDLLEWHFGLVWPVRAAEKRTEPHVRGKAESGARCPDRASGSPGVVGASGSRRRVSDACHWLLGSRPSGDRDSRQGQGAGLRRAHCAGRHRHVLTFCSDLRATAQPCRHGKRACFCASRTQVTGLGKVVQRPCWKAASVPEWLSGT